MPRKTTRESAEQNKLASASDSKSTARKTTTAKKATARKTPSASNGAKRTSRATRTRPEPAGIQAQPPAEIGVAASPTDQWRRMDVHMHTPGSADYEQPEIHYLDILRQAERRGLDIIAFTDHNTVNGYRNMQREIANLEMLERLGRIRADEMGRLHEYRRLLKKMLVLPGFELTATFGFHIIGLFPPDKPLRDIEFILLQLRVPSRVIDMGLTEAGATSDVLTAYRLIVEGGGIAIAPHANSSNGVFMRGLNIGGQTRMAYTQDEHLSAIELTDLAKGRRSMAVWFNGNKPEYSRRMHIIQGSDAHRLVISPTESKRLGVGERATEVLLPELSFNALRDLFASDDFSRERPASAVLDVPSDVLRSAREKGNNDSQSFHPILPKRNDRFSSVLSDVCAFANTNGGSIYIGCDPFLLKPAVGVPDAEEVATALAETIQQRITPALNVTIDLQNSDGVDLLRVAVPRGDNAPYALDATGVYVRNEADTHVATRDELVSIVRRAVGADVSTGASKPTAESRPPQHAQRQQAPGHRQQQPQSQPRQQQPQSNAQQPASQPRSGQQGQQQRDQGRRNQQKDQQPRRDQASSRQSPQIVNGNKPAQPSQLDTMGPVDSGKADLPVEPIKTLQLPPPPVEPQAEGSPRSGVEILSVEERDGTRYYTVRDLRNKSIVRNVTQKSARDLWLYAIMQHMNDVYDVDQITWQNDRCILSRSQRAGKVRYDLALRDGAGKVHIFYGVADDAMDSRWKELIQATMPASEEGYAQTAAFGETPQESDTASSRDAQMDTAAGGLDQPALAEQFLSDAGLESGNTPVPESQSE